MNSVECENGLSIRGIGFLYIREVSGYRIIFADEDEKKTRLDNAVDIIVVDFHDFTNTGKVDAIWKCDVLIQLTVIIQ